MISRMMMMMQGADPDVHVGALTLATREITRALKRAPSRMSPLGRGAARRTRSQSPFGAAGVALSITSAKSSRATSNPGSRLDHVELAVAQVDGVVAGRAAHDVAGDVAGPGHVAPQQRPQVVVPGPAVGDVAAVVGEDAVVAGAARPACRRRGRRGGGRCRGRRRSCRCPGRRRACRSGPSSPKLGVVVRPRPAGRARRRPASVSAPAAAAEAVQVLKRSPASLTSPVRASFPVPPSSRSSPAQPCTVSLP